MREVLHQTRTHWVRHRSHNDWNGRRGTLGGLSRERCSHNNHVHLLSHEFLRKSGQPSSITGTYVPVNDYIPSFHVSRFKYCPPELLSLLIVHHLRDNGNMPWRCGRLSTYAVGDSSDRR